MKKICKSCKQLKPHHAKGLCNNCYNKQLGHQRTWYLNNKERISKMRKQYRKEYGEEINRKRRERKKQYNLTKKKWARKNKDQLKQYRDNNPEKIKAQNRANHYISIQKGQLCQICNKALATEKHHEDYSKPLKVEFVCSICHKKIHKNKKGG